MSDNRTIGMLVGAVAGFFTGGLSYVAIGASLGGFVGGLLDPGVKTEGPRLEDRKVSVSTYGLGKALLYGTNMVGPNWLWSTDKLEIATTTEAGKGGGAENTTYEYYIHGFMDLGISPPPGTTVAIRKVFEDGKLKWDASSGTSVRSALASEESPYTDMVLLPGFEDQQPISLMEAWMGGPGTVPAYRGTVGLYIIALRCPGGRVPQLSFEISTCDLQTIKTEFAAIEDDAGIATPDAIWSWQTTVAANPTITISRTGPGEPTTVISEVDLGLYYVEFGEPFAINGSNPPSVMYAFGEQKSIGDEVSTIRTIDLTTGAVEVLYEAPYDGGSTAIGMGSSVHAAYDPILENYAVTRGYIDAEKGLTILPAGRECDVVDIQLTSPLAFYAAVIYALSYDGTNIQIVRVDGVTGNHIDTLAGPVVGSVDLRYCSIQVDADGVWVRVYSTIESHNYSVLIDAGVATWTQMPGDSDFIGNTSPGPFPSSISYFTPGSSIVGPNAQGEWTFIRYQVVVPVPVPVGPIIADLIERAGETRYDISEIPDTDVLWGIKFTNPASARANMEPLLTAFAYYIVDEDGLIKVKRYQDIESVATVTYEELGQAEDDAEAGDAMPLVRKQQVDFARSWTVNYLDPEFDYQTASEVERRQVTDSTEDMQTDIVMSTNSDHAKRVASMLLFVQWRGQNTRSCRLSRKYAFLSPGDGLTVEYPKGSFRLWRITAMTDTGALIELSLEPGDAEIYTQTAIGATGYESQTVAPLASPQMLELIDGPILQDADNNAGIYAAMEPYGQGTPGAELFVGPDDSSLQSRGTVNNAAVIGFAENALGDWPSELMDEENALIVNIGEGQLNTTTRALIDTTTINAFALGVNGRWEYGQFLRATDLGDGRFMLTGLIRGSRGTERNRSNHSSGDRFVMLALPGMLRPSMDVGSIGSTDSYRAVSKGRSLNSTTSIRYANTAEGLSPFSPWDPRWTKATTNDITMTWERRTRLSSNSLRGVVPLGEATESYVIELYTSSALTTLAGTFTSNTNSLTVTSAQQSSIGLTPGATPYRRIYQVSESVGRGAPLEAIS